MTRPAPWRRTTAKQRREQREAYRQLAARVAANPSAETLRYRAKNRGDADRNRAKEKLNRALAGGAIRGFSAAEMAKLKPEEVRMLWEEMHNRLGQLSPEERAALNERNYLAMVAFSVEQLRAIAGSKRP